MDADGSQVLDARIAALETELWQLKRQRAQRAGPSPKALDGIRVLDLSRFIFGPFCTQMLADMGADIIKVEPIGVGDPARLAGIVSVNGVSTSFLARNRNKRSICLDLRKAAGQEIALRLVDRCDVLIHNFRPDVMPRLGLDPKRVRERNPGLIYCSLSGYGQTGPRADWPGQDLLVQAMSGIISTTGWDDGPPVAVGAYMADVAGALTAAYGVLTALYARSQYGIGQEIEVSLLDSMIAFQAMETVSFLNSNVLPRKSGSGHWLLPQPYGVYHTKDKDLAVNAHSNDWWGRLCRAPAFAHLGTDLRLATPTSRLEHRAELTQALQEILLTKTRDEWLEYLGQYDVLCAPVYDYQELFADPQVHHNQMVVEQEHPKAGRVKVIGIPVKFSETPGEVGPAAPLLGEHTEEILHWLGYGADAIDRLRQQKVLSPES
jgi:crotonobetainyl-CoA:carnitine CoA-transferase CaiB-like acyl-CoA transferase